MKERENEWRNPALTGASDLVSSLTIIEGMKMIDTAKMARHIETLLLISEINIAILEIVTEEYPEIFRKAILQVVDKHPEQFKKKEEPKCPKCETELHKTHGTPDYWMCYKCIKGYNNEELKKE